MEVRASVNGPKAQRAPRGTRDAALLLAVVVGDIVVFLDSTIQGLVIKATSSRPIATFRSIVSDLSAYKYKHTQKPG